jgi:hypothetical protein
VAKKAAATKALSKTLEGSRWFQLRDQLTKFSSEAHTGRSTTSIGNKQNLFSKLTLKQLPENKKMNILFVVDVNVDFAIKCIRS